MDHKLKTHDHAIARSARLAATSLSSKSAIVRGGRRGADGLRL